MRALRYHNKGHAKSDQDKIVYDEAMDETGTINIAELSDFDAYALGEQYQKILTATTLDMKEIMEIRALRHHNKSHVKSDQEKILYNEAMDKTGNIDTAELSDFDADALGKQYQKILTATTLETKEMMEIADEIL